MKTSINVEFTPEEIHAIYTKLHAIETTFDFNDEEFHDGVNKLIFAYETNVIPCILTAVMLSSGTLEDGTKFVWVNLYYGSRSLMICYEKHKEQQWIWCEGANEFLPDHVRTYWHEHADAILDKLHAGKDNVQLVIPNNI